MPHVVSELDRCARRRSLTEDEGQQLLHMEDIAASSGVVGQDEAVKAISRGHPPRRAWV